MEINYLKKRLYCQTIFEGIYCHNHEDVDSIMYGSRVAQEQLPRSYCRGTKH